MEHTVEVSIPIAPAAAEKLADPRNREAVGRLISRLLGPRSKRSPLAEALCELQASAREAGLTEDEVNAELDAYNTECRGAAASP